MPPKKPSTTGQVVDTRTPTEIELDSANEFLDQLNDQLQRCKDGITEMSTLATKIRGLEIEMQPKELELKTIVVGFGKVLEAASGLKRPVAMLRTQAAAAAANTADDINEPSPAAAAATAGGTSPPQSQGGSRPTTVPAPLLGSAAAATSLQPPPSSAAAQDDSGDRETLKTIAAASKAFMALVLQSVFDTPITPSEKRAEVEEGADLLALAANTKKAENARLDPDITCPIGVEPSVFFDVLKLRAQRILVDRTLVEFQAQLNDAKAIVAKRKDEGASKILQKRLEKQIEDARKRVLDLQRERDGQEMSRRAAALAQQEAAQPPPSKQKSSAKMK